MTQLGLLLWLLAAPVAHPAQQAQPEAPPLPRIVDPCEMAKRIAAQGPCLRADDCGALRSWERLFGAPRVEPLEPRLAIRATSGSDVATSFVCPAAAELRGRRFR